MALADISPILHETLAGHYVLKREIGRGGAATVYLAHDIRHERLVAIKVLHPELSHALGAQRFLREIKLTASLQHPHILPIHDSGQASDQLYYVMPYVEGDSMRQRLGADNRLSIEESVRIGREVAGALAYAHERGVVHRDIKPENILFSGGHAVLADFGIARAIDRAHEKITQQGTITGTPAYMSPEQARDRAFDGRSDVYSLACVLYEAMAGVPPFIGDTPQSLLTQRVSKTPPLLREYRHDVPAAVESVIARALSISPDDRFDDARAFSAALSAAIGNSGEMGAMRATRGPLSGRAWPWLAAVVVVAALGFGTTDRGREWFDILAGRVDKEQYAVIPFQYVGAAAPAQEEVSQGLYAALSEWNGLKVASDLKVTDVLRQSSDTSFSGMLTIARRVRAGRVVWGRVTVSRDSMKIRAGVYDAVDGTRLRELTLAGRRDMLASGNGVLRGLANDLIRLDGTAALSHAGDAGTRSLVAWRAYQEGQKALATWQVKPAIAAFQQAIAADPDYGHAHAWLAQLLLWHGEPKPAWEPHAGTAARARTSLDGREVLVLDAVQAMQIGHYDAACRSYDSLRVRDSLDAGAWLGLAYCQTLNPLVVRSSASRSGFAFQGSFAAAQHAYLRAIQIAPASYDAMPDDFRRRLFVTESGRIRFGKLADSSDYFAFPDLMNDTIAYTAYSIREVHDARVLVVAPANAKALGRNRETMLALLTTMTQRAPDNSDVFESLARVLEARDEITGTPNGGYSALSALDRARALAADSAQRARLGAADVRLHLKLGDFGRAAAIGDSILAAVPSATGEVAVNLAGIAALLGREHAATVYLRSSGESVAESLGPSVPLIEDALTALYMRAALGACDDSLRALQVKVGALLERYVSLAQREVARRGMLVRPMEYALACSGASPTLTLSGTLSPITQTMQVFARGDLAKTHRMLDSMRMKTAARRQGELNVDLTMAQAWLFAAVGDTTEATHTLDLMLTALPTLSMRLLSEAGMAASVGRSMAFRAELATRTGDAGTAALWAGRVLTLWSHADPSVAPTLARMRAIAAHRS
ncbi:MAG: serine/threonine-protein kinase [bacterium]